MKRNVKVLSLITVLILGMAMVWAGIAGAHGSKVAAGMKLTFGGTDEPVITGMRSWMEVAVVDEVTGEPVLGLEKEEKLSLTVRNGEWSRKIPMAQIRTKPGAYKVGIWFQQAGAYDFVIAGTKADGTEFSVKEHKEIADHSELFFPPVSK